QSNSIKFDESSFITFNYDIGLDFALRCSRSHEINYGFDSDKFGVKLLKLHGSINWKLNKGKNVDIEDLQKYKKNEIVDSRPYDSGIIDLKINNPFIIPPTWNKGKEYEMLKNVWKTAAKELKEASNIYVLGYSLPETDTFFRYLFALGTMGEFNLRKFWIYDPDINAKVRYEELLGRGISEKGFKHFELKFGEVLDNGDKGW
ncbi:hypothetical protein ACFL4O_02920, partial [bacterium]